MLDLDGVPALVAAAVEEDGGDVTTRRSGPGTSRGGARLADDAPHQTAGDCRAAEPRLQAWLWVGGVELPRRSALLISWPPLFPLPCGCPVLSLR